MLLTTNIALLLAAAYRGVASQSEAPHAPDLGGKKHYEEGVSTGVLFAAAPIGNEINRSKWRVTCDSQERNFECRNAIDGKSDTFWHTAYDKNDDPLPHSIVVDMGSTYNLNGISALPRQDGNQNGFIAQHELAISTDNSTWEVVAYGTWYGDDTEKFGNFETKEARYFRITATTEVNGNPWTSIADIKAYQSQDGPRSNRGLGRWGLTINFPTVPVAGMVNPVSGEVTIWSAFAYDNYQGSTSDKVSTAIWNIRDKTVSAELITNSHHDMFCPGISIDGTGRMIVTGGNSAKKTTFMDFTTGRWSLGPDMNIARGYQSSAVCSDGRVFTIGGSWSGGRGGKNGEIYDPRSNNWELLPGCPVKPMLTNDHEGVYRADNHAWLFGWKDGYVFQAGPSRAMNWYNVKGKGKVIAAGNRRSQRGDDDDAMTGNAVMFDATRGRILTFGGAPSYQDSNAGSNAYLIKLGESGSKPEVEFASNGLNHARSFHTSVVLPDGHVFITGGQTYAVPFSDNDAVFEPEMYDPEKDRFYKMQPNSIVRVYHSISLLLPDATVFTAGGGLCGDCTTNHFDGQIYTPQYLLNEDGSLAVRPKIKSASVEASGQRLNITTDGPVASASLIRFGTATHTVNTDQRRIPLDLNLINNSQYSADLPDDSGVLLPGYYMLFVIDKNGVPSVSKTLDLTKA